MYSKSSNNIFATSGLPDSKASIDSGVINKIPLGLSIRLSFFALLASPCQDVIGIFISKHISFMRLNWSLIRAIRGEIYKIFTPLSQFLTLLMAGKKAASVFPDAVAADKIKLFSVEKNAFIDAF